MDKTMEMINAELRAELNRQEQLTKAYQSLMDIALSVMRMTDETPSDDFDEAMDKIIALKNSVKLEGN